MRTIIKTSVLIAVITLFFSCKIIHIPVSSTTPSNNQTYQVDYLFEHEGCKVYRFMDRGNYVYFTNRDSDITSIKNDSTHTRVVNTVRNIGPK